MQAPFYFTLATHKYLTNKEGGYFYRFYPKLSRIRIDGKNTFQATLFNPLPEESTHFTLTDIYGKFIDKYKDGKDLIIIFLWRGEFSLTDLLLNKIEIRTLQSKILITASAEIYNYPFVKNNIYSLSVHEVKDITP